MSGEEESLPKMLSASTFGQPTLRQTYFPHSVVTSVPVRTSRRKQQVPTQNCGKVALKNDTCGFAVKEEQQKDFYSRYDRHVVKIPSTEPGYSEEHGRYDCPNPTVKRTRQVSLCGKKMSAAEGYYRCGNVGKTVIIKNDQEVVAQCLEPRCVEPSHLAIVAALTKSEKVKKAKSKEVILSPCGVITSSATTDEKLEAVVDAFACPQPPTNKQATPDTATKDDIAFFRSEMQKMHSVLVNIQQSLNILVTKPQ
jgi:hypothetical protein